MGVSLIGSAVVWGLVTSMTGGNWQAGLVVGLIVLGMCVSGVKAQAAATARRSIVIVEDEDPQQTWF